jgi:hypothetical protein
MIEGNSGSGSVPQLELQRCDFSQGMYAPPRRLVLGHATLSSSQQSLESGVAVSHLRLDLADPEQSHGLVGNLKGLS